MKSVLLRFSEKWFRSENGCWIWTGSRWGKQNYGRMIVDGKKTIAHRVSWTLFRGIIPDRTCVIHKCDTPLCVNPDHLFLGTKLDNNRDRNQKGRSAKLKGNDNPACKLTADNVLSIRDDPRFHRVIARDYDITRANVGLIKQRKIWTHI